MTLKYIFRKYFAVTVGILFAFLFLANFTLNLIVSSNNRPPLIRSPVFFARLLDDLGPDRLENFKRLERINQNSLPFQFYILNESGGVIAGDPDFIPEGWEETDLPRDPLEFTYLGPEKDIKPPQTFFPFPRVPPPPPPTKDVHHYHPGSAPGGPPLNPRPRDQIIRLPGEKIQYLVIHFKTDESRKISKFQAYGLSLALLISSILIGVGVALTFIFRSLAKKLVLADSVIAELQSGNLKARFPIKKRDEFGAAMVRFNQMADEIERLVERLINTEKSRMKLLQELAHDLRTPVASLKNLLETLQTREGSLDPTVKTELISLSVKEIDYFERLIEDLLILAQVSEPRYHPKKDQVDLAAILNDEADSTLHHTSSGKPLSFEKDIEVESLITQGDTLLLRRMFRNVLLNAISFAKHTVRISLRKAEPSLATIVIEDDGPGLSAEALKSFGVRRMTRVLGSSQDGRLSVGLGSVIVKTVAELHRGWVQVENRLDSMGNIAGARIILTIKLHA